MASSRKAVPSVKLVTLTFLVLTLCLQVCVGAPGVRRKRQAYSDELFYTSVCENSTMDLRCPPGKLIYIEYANFGRTDNVTCVNEPVQTITCDSSIADDIVKASCNNRGTCTIHATMQLFSDPCPDEPTKFLEVKLRCRPPTPTTVPPTTPRVTTTRPTTTPMPQPQELTTRYIQHVTEMLPVDATTLLPDVETTTELPTTTTRKPTTRATTTVAATMPTLEPLPRFCMPVIVRGVQWEHAPAGTVNEQPCPKGHTGFALWECTRAPARWKEPGPDLSGCVSIKLANITNQLNQGGSVTTLSEDLAQTVEEEDLTGGDILAVTNIMTTSLGNLEQELQNATVEEKATKTKEVTKNYLKVGSAILEDNSMQSWTDDMDNRTKSETASSLITSLEESAFLLADTLDDDQTVVEEEDNVVMEVVVRGENDGSDLVFPNSDQLSGNWKGITDSITLPADSIRERTKNGKTKIVILAYNNIGALLGINGTTKRPPVTTPRTEMQKDGSKGGCYDDEPVIVTSEEDQVNSRVLSISINDPWDSRPLSKPINLTFQHQVTGDNDTSVADPVCSFWKFDNHSNEFRSGEWSDNGCVLVHSNETHTVCSCDHLTNFAIIMNVKGFEIPKAHQFALSIITYFGFVISIPCLILTLITFCMFKNLQSDRTTIHKNLCITLILAELIFVAGINQTGNKTACAIIAMLLHYFFLSAFAWMCLEGIQLYIMLVEVFEAESSRRKYYYPFGYVLPLVIVGISAGIDFSSYGTPKYCWICAENSFIWSFLGPVCLIIFGNILFLSMALFIMCKHSSIQTNPKEKTPKEKATSLVRGAVVLLCLLGVTWAFGLLYISDNLIVFAYIFTIFNSLQGLFIYIFHCCMNDKVRKEYRRYIRNSTWLPTCIQEQYGGMILTNSKEPNSYRSSSVAKRTDSKRFSNATGSYSIENRKMSNSSVVRNSSQYDQVRFNSEMSVPEEESLDLMQPMALHVADEGISMDYDPIPIHESTRLEVRRNSQDDARSRLSVGTTEFQPLIVDSDSDSEKHATLIQVKQGNDEEDAPRPIEMHPLIRESGFGGSRSSSSCDEEDFTPASPTSQDMPNKAHVFANCSTVGMTGSMPDLINPLTAHARKARMDLVPITCNNNTGHTSKALAGNNNSTNVANVTNNAASNLGSKARNGASCHTPATNNIHNGYHTLPQRSASHQKEDSPPHKANICQLKGDSDLELSPWYKRASRIDDIDSCDVPEQRKSFSTPSSPQSTNSKSLLETMI